MTTKTIVHRYDDPRPSRRPNPAELTLLLQFLLWTRGTTLVCESDLPYTENIRRNARGQVCVVERHFLARSPYAVFAPRWWAIPAVEWHETWKIRDEEAS